ncbi:AmpG muropeptide MFS transporter [beta proteobacterium KB13]|uniref:AmpG muropeptide MFS transporter n=1 Tax=beta proteobacterium KB13 TaxID=314607 RepID=B6BW35_9PROT|nr:AmpG muropeptide MFS transporter [beta proteobacterium KB13]
MNKYLKVILNKKMGICCLTGFSSGLPLFILISLIPAWLRIENIDLKVIGLFSLIQLPFTWKFIWAPIFDRYRILMGRRRGWLIVFQILLLLSIASLGFFNAAIDLKTIALISFLIAIFSASHDVVIDAYRREILDDAELGIGNAIHVNAYKISSLIPGSLSLILADMISWQNVFLITSLFMFVGIGMTLAVKEPDTQYIQPKNFKDSVIQPFISFFKKNGRENALYILLFIFLYKLGDSMATALVTPFYIDLNFSMTEIGIIAKNAGLWASVIGGFLGGIWMIKIGINKALWIFGFLQLVTIIPFIVLSMVGHNLILLGITVGLESFAMGLGTTALIAFISKQTDPRYTATQFAMFTSLASIPRSITNASTGFIVESLGWTNFFYLCFMLAIPGMLLLLKVAPYKLKS